MASQRSQRRRISGASTRAHHVDQPMCMLGMAAYWLKTAAISSLQKDAHPPYTATVSTNPNSSHGGSPAAGMPPASSSSGGASGETRHPPEMPGGSIRRG